MTRFSKLVFGAAAVAYFSIYVLLSSCVKIGPDKQLVAGCGSF